MIALYKTLQKDTQIKNDTEMVKTALNKIESNDEGDGDLH